MVENKGRIQLAHIAWKDGGVADLDDSRNIGSLCRSGMNIRTVKSSSSRFQASRPFRAAYYLSSSSVSWLPPTMSSRSSYWRAWFCHIHRDSRDRSRCGVRETGRVPREFFPGFLENLPRE